MTGISTTRAVERCERLAALGPAPPWWRVFAVRRWLRAYRAIMALDISVHAEMLRSMYPAESIKQTAERTNATASLLAARPGVRVVAVDAARGIVEYEEP